MPAAEPTAARRADARRNQAALLEAADAVLREQGEGFALEAVARRAGVGKGTLYRHFPTREDLLDGLLTAWVAGIETHVDAVLEGPRDADLLRRFLSRLLPGLPDDGSGLAILRRHDRDAAQRLRLLAAFERLTTELRAAGAVDPGTVRDDVLLALAMLDAAARAAQRRAAHGEPVDVHRQLEVLVRGLAPIG